MPTYEYRCDKCGRNLEVFQRFADKPLRRHAECGGTLEKVFHPSGVVFKGSGFYVTDSRQKSNGKKPDKPAKESVNGSDSTSAGISADKAAVTSSESKSD